MYGTVLELGLAVPFNTKANTSYAKAFVIEVLSFVWRNSGMQFAGITQLMPFGVSKEQAAAALQSMAKALGGSVPLAHETLKLSRDSMAWQQYRSSTKFLLRALANSLQQCMPDGFSLKQCIPDNILAPSGSNGTRCFYLPEELALAGLPDGSRACFVFDSPSGLRFPDFYVKETFYRLVVSCDEGTEVPLLCQTNVERYIWIITSVNV